MEADYKQSYFTTIKWAICEMSIMSKLTVFINQYVKSILKEGFFFFYPMMPLLVEYTCYSSKPDALVKLSYVFFGKMLLRAFMM